MAYEINFCETKEQLKHLSEVVTGRVDGKATGAVIEDSTLAYLGQARETLDTLLAKIGWYSVGDWSTDPLVEFNNQFVTYNGVRYVPLTLPYQVNSTANPDPDVLVGTQLKVITDVTDGDLTGAQEEIIGGNIFPEAGLLANGMTVPVGTTHLRVSVGGKSVIVSMSPVASGVVSLLTETGATIGGSLVEFIPLNITDESFALEFYSIEDLKIRKSKLGKEVTLAEGDKVKTGLTTWLITSDSNDSLAILGGLYAIPLNGVHVADYASLDITGTTAFDVEFEEAISINRTIRIPNGKIKITAKKTCGTATIVRGVGPESQIDAQMSDALFEFPRGTGRSVKKWRDFSVISTTNSMTNGVAFLIPGTESGQGLIYTSGYYFENIEVGGGGEFGCVWDISDTFRFTARDCGYSSVTNPIRIRGSVVQCTIDNVTGNNTDYLRSYDGENAGVHMSTRSDYSDAITRVPENVKILNCGFVNHRRGILSTGLAIQTINCDLDFIRDIGWEYGGGDGHTLRGGYIAHSGQDFTFIGILVRKAQNIDSVNINGVEINAYSVVASSQIAIQTGDGNAAPFAEAGGATINDCFINGPALSWDFGIQADRNLMSIITSNRFSDGVIKAGGIAINASNAKNLTCNHNICIGQDIYISAPDATAVVTAVNNNANVVTEFMAPPAANIEIARNRATYT